MVENLEKKYSLIGKTYDEIVQLLGTNGVVPGSSLTYYAGKGYIGMIFYVVTFDESNKVIDAGIVQD